MREEKQDLRWGLYFARTVAGIGLATVGVAADYLIDGGSVAAQWGGVGALAGAIIGFGTMLAHYPRGDEFDRAIDRVTSVHAGLAVMVLLIAQELSAQMGWFGAKHLPIYTMPGFFIILKTLESQLFRAALAEGSSFPGLSSLRA
ncbi:hypothetical protein WNY37_00220 [Henriciella sp. AS95]|uniref:hypothetical protein n=1 Tax=Henriciella sp. AS95 TaxID=3135782 RepID=UPI003174370E